MKYPKKYDVDWKGDVNEYFKSGAYSYFSTSELNDNLKKEQ